MQKGDGLETGSGQVKVSLLQSDLKPKASKCPSTIFARL